MPTTTGSLGPVRGRSTTFEAIPATIAAAIRGMYAKPVVTGE
jgi:hypothetical protein